MDQMDRHTCGGVGGERTGSVTSRGLSRRHQMVDYKSNANFMPSKLCC
jgi:hypothetical protein